MALLTFASNVEAVFSGFQDAGNAAEKNIITQQMMLTAMVNQNTISKYGVATARASQDTVWAITAELAQDTLPILFTLVKCMLYASVVLLAPMMLLYFKKKRWTSLLEILFARSMLSTVMAVFLCNTEYVCRDVYKYKYFRLR